MTTSTTKPEQKSTEAPPLKRSLWKRLLIRLVLVLLVAAVGGAGYVYYRSYRIISSEPYQAAMKYVINSKILKGKVGEPLVTAGFLENLRDGSSVTDNGDVGEAQIRFNVMSPKGPVNVTGAGRKDKGEWAITDLTVMIPGNERVNLYSEVLLDTGGDTPKFDPTKKEDIKQPVLPETSNDIKIEIPGM